MFVARQCRRTGPVTNRWCAQPADPAVQTLVLQELARVDWIEKSDVAALREGVIERMELQIGMPVQAGGTIGVLHHEMAELTVKKNDLQAKQLAPKEKAEAQFFVAASKVARDKRLNDRKGNMVSAEEVAEHEGEMRVADAGAKRPTRTTRLPRPSSTWPCRP